MSNAEPAAPQPLTTLLLLLDLEREARQAASRQAMRYVAVNHTRRLFAFRQAAFLEVPAHGRPRLAAVSNLAEVERDAPYVRWLETVAEREVAGSRASEIHSVDPTTLTERLRKDWGEWSAPYALWCPLPMPGAASGQRPAAVLWLARDEPWQDGELVLLDRLADAFGHAWWAADGRRRAVSGRGRLRRLVPVLGLAAIAAALAVPVPSSTLAPAEVAAREPAIVAAPLDGVIERFLTRPNEPVREGQALLLYEETVPRSRFEIAKRALSAAEAELMTATQGAFADPQSKARLALLKTQVDLRRAELDYARDQLDRVTVKAERSGIAVFADVNDWIGRPVTVGERILSIADPERAEIDIRVPVADAIALEAGAQVRVFLNVDPLRPIAATVTEASYEPGVTQAGVLAFRVRAQLAEGQPVPRIGLRGTARIEGPPVPLVLYLFRRPLAALRQTIGY